MKRRMRQEGVKRLLEHLESNPENTSVRMESHLKQRAPSLEHFNKVRDFCVDLHLIRMMPYGKGETRDYELSITMEGSEYLDRVDLRRMQEAQTSFNKIIALTSLIISFTAFLSFMDKDLAQLVAHNATTNFWGLVTVVIFAAIMVWALVEIIGELLLIHKTRAEF